MLARDAGPAAGSGGTEPVFRTVVRHPGQDGVFTSRIPALAITPKGALLASFGLRHATDVDVPGDIDVAVSRSFDQGNTWTPAKRILDFDKNEPDTLGNGVDDPTIVVDRVTGTIFITAQWVRGRRFAKGPPIPLEKAARCLLTKSTDDGVTWSPPIDITNQIQDPAWGHAVLVTGPGIGIQLSDRTLVIPAYFKSYPEGRRGDSFFIWSQDQGVTWHRSAPAMPGMWRTSESQIAQLADGSLLLSMRNHGSVRHRAWARYTWKNDLAQGSWSEPWFVVQDPTCMASVIQHPAGPLLFSNPNSTSARTAMTVRSSTDGGRTWNAGRLIDAGLSGYSCLTVFKDGSVGLLYEGGKKKYNETLHFARFPLEWITSAGGQASVPPPVKPGSK